MVRESVMNEYVMACNSIRDSLNHLIADTCHIRTRYSKALANLRKELDDNGYRMPLRKYYVKIKHGK